MAAWTKRFIQIAKVSGNTEARAWARKFIPAECTKAVKAAVEHAIGLKRPPDDTKPA